MAPTVTDLKQTFMAAQLGVPLSSIQDLEKQFYERYQTGGLSQLVIFNVKDYGARGDNVTDDAAAGYAQAEAQSAVTAVNAIRAALTAIGITL